MNKKNSFLHYITLIKGSLWTINAWTLRVNINSLFPIYFVNICHVVCQGKQFRCCKLASTCLCLILMFYLFLYKPQIIRLKLISSLRLRTTSQAFWLQRRWLTLRRKKSWRITWWRLTYWHLVTMTTLSSYWMPSTMRTNSGWAHIT